MDEPDFTRHTETPQKCKDHAMWQQQFVTAYWILLLTGGFFLFFTDSEQLGIALIGMSMLIFLIRLFLDGRHLRWHIRNADDETNE